MWYTLVKVSFGNGEGEDIANKITPRSFFFLKIDRQHDTNFSEICSSQLLSICSKLKHKKKEKYNRQSYENVLKQQH